MKIDTLPTTRFCQNTRFITCEETSESIIVDPGGDTNKLINFINKNGINVKAILLTHGHLDHVGAADELRSVLSVNIIGPHKDEKFWFDALPMQANMFGFENTDIFYPDQWVSHGEIFKIGNLSFEVKFCPGHTPGHVVFYNRVHSKVIVGDVLFKGSIGRTDFPKGNLAQLKQSIMENLFTLPDETEVLSGHGENTTIGFEKYHNPFVSGDFG